MKSVFFCAVRHGNTSLPTRERGLKLEDVCLSCHVVIVAPYAGAWIEIVPHAHPCASIVVAPYAGAWIEIFPHPYP